MVNLKAINEQNTIYFCYKCYSFLRKHHKKLHNNKDLITLDIFRLLYLENGREWIFYLAKKCGYFVDGFPLSIGFSISPCFTMKGQKFGCELPLMTRIYEVNDPKEEEPILKKRDFKQLLEASTDTIEVNLTKQLI